MCKRVLKEWSVCQNIKSEYVFSFNRCFLVLDCPNRLSCRERPDLGNRRTCLDGGFPYAFILVDRRRLDEMELVSIQADDPSFTLVLPVSNVADFKSIYFKPTETQKLDINNCLERVGCAQIGEWTKEWCVTKIICGIGNTYHRHTAAWTFWAIIIGIAVAVVS